MSLSILVQKINAQTTSASSKHSFEAEKALFRVNWTISIQLSCIDMGHTKLSCLVFRL